MANATPHLLPRGERLLQGTIAELLSDSATEVEVNNPPSVDELPTYFELDPSSDNPETIRVYDVSGNIIYFERGVYNSGVGREHLPNTPYKQKITSQHWKKVVDAVEQGYLPEDPSITLTRNSASEFVIEGVDRTDYYIDGRVVRFNSSDANTATIESSILSTGDTVITLKSGSGSVPSPLNSVEIAIQPRGYVPPYLTSLDVLDEDDFSSDSETKVPSQQSTKAYVDNKVSETLIDEDDFSSNSDTKAPTQQSTKEYIKSQLSGDGWVPSSDTWVYTSASSFTIAGVDRTAIFQKGTYLRFKQGGGYKYAVVLSSSFSTNTTVNIFVNTDYTIANSSITDNDYSYALNPEGWPTDFTRTLTINGSGGSAGTYAATTYFSKYRVIGRRVYEQVSVQVTNKGSWSGQIQLLLAATTAASYPGTYNAPVNCFISNTSSIPVAASLACGSVMASSNIMQFLDSIGVSLIQWSAVGSAFYIHGQFDYLF